MSWRLVRLELGCTGEFPGGSVGRAYLLRLPLNDRDEVDEEALDLSPGKATVRRHWSTEPDESGHIRRADGSLSMRCDGKDRHLRLDSRPIRLGEQVSVVEPNGQILPFRIASVR